MKWLLAALVTMVAVVPIIAHATALSVDAGTLQVISIPFSFEPPATGDEQCKNGRWETVVTDNGDDFKNQGACVSYVNGGGVLHPKPASGESADGTSITTSTSAPTGAGVDALAGHDLWSRELEELAAQPCLDDGWRSQLDESGLPYVSEEACVEAKVAEYRERTTSTEQG